MRCSISAGAAGKRLVDRLVEEASVLGVDELCEGLEGAPSTAEVECREMVKISSAMNSTRPPCEVPFPVPDMGEALRLAKQSLVAGEPVGVAQASDAIGEVVSQFGEDLDLVGAEGAGVAGVDHERPDRLVAHHERQGARPAEAVLVGRSPPGGEVMRPVGVVEHLHAACSNGCAGWPASRARRRPNRRASPPGTRCGLRTRDRSHGARLVVLDRSRPMPTGTRPW